jgi:hypothetical protein
MRGILISTEPEDRDFGMRLRQSLALKVAEHSVDYVTLTSDISERPVRTAMISALALVAVVSASSGRGERVIAEAGLAVSVGRPVVVMARGEEVPEEARVIEAARWVRSFDEGDIGALAGRVLEIVSDLAER